MIYILPAARLLRLGRLTSTVRNQLTAGVRAGTPVTTQLRMMRARGLSVRTQSATDFYRLTRARLEQGPKRFRLFDRGSLASRQGLPTFVRQPTRFSIDATFWHERPGVLSKTFNARFQWTDPKLSADDIRAGLRAAAREQLRKQNVTFKEKKQGYELSTPDFDMHNFYEYVPLSDLKR